MIKMLFTDAEIKALHYERYHHPHPRVQRKMEVLWLKSQGVGHKEIARLSGVSATTLTRYLREYEEGGLEKLREIRFYRPASDMKRYERTLEAHFREHLPVSAKAAMATIERLTGLKRSENRVREFLKTMGLKLRKVGMVPAKADVEVQEGFKKNT
jgi:transposase